LFLEYGSFIGWFNNGLHEQLISWLAKRLGKTKLNKAALEELHEIDFILYKTDIHARRAPFILF